MLVRPSVGVFHEPTDEKKYIGVAGKPSALKDARSVCAVRRVMVFLLQAGGTGEMFLGYWHT